MVLKESKVIVKNKILVMKDLKDIILEKLQINSKSQVYSKTNDDPLSWEVGDIFWFDGFHIEFYKIIKRTSKQFELHNIPVKLISGYLLIIDKRKGYAGLWNGKPVEGCGLK